MTWTATTRYGLEVAPDGLALVHDFLSTGASGRPRQPDLLSDPALATEWLSGALSAWARQWSTPVLDEADLGTLTERDLTVLRRVRDELVSSLRRTHLDGGGAEDGSGARLDLSDLQVGVEAGFGSDGTVHFKPKGRGWRMLLGPVALEIRRAQDAGAWPRLKSCKNDRCRGVFYDRSRNNSGVWHDVRTCGNAANLRASRARRRNGGQAGSQSQAS